MTDRDQALPQTLVSRLRSTAADMVDFHGKTMKDWDEIRGKVETLKGSDLPRLMFEALIESFAELMTEAADALDGVEAASQQANPGALFDAIMGAAKLFTHDHGVAYQITRVAMETLNTPQPNCGQISATADGDGLSARIDHFRSELRAEKFARTLKTELRISSDHDHRPWRDIERAVLALTTKVEMESKPRSPADSGGKS